jgi:hypothetical protein
MFSKTDASTLLEERLKEVNLKNIYNIIDANYFNKESLKSEITNYLKKITRLCNSYIDNKFLGNDEKEILKKILKRINEVTCRSKNIINAVYDLIEESRITTDEERKKFKIDLHNLISFGAPRKKTEEEFNYEYERKLLEKEADRRRDIKIKKKQNT